MTWPRGGNDSGRNARGADARDGNDSASYQQAVVLSVGSNLGDRPANLQLGLDVLGRGGLELHAVSSVYETDPVGGPDQADYLNAVLLAGSSLAPRDILARCAAAEAAASRVRTQRWGPRTLDVDIIACGCVISADPALTLPHPRAHERAFVLVPWLELDPQAVLPGHGPVAELVAEVPTGGVRRRPDLRLALPDGPSRGCAEYNEPAQDEPPRDEPAQDEPAQDGPAHDGRATGLAVPGAEAPCS